MDVLDSFCFLKPRRVALESHSLILRAMRCLASPRPPTVGFAALSTLSLVHFGLLCVFYILLFALDNSNLLAHSTR